MRIVRTISEIRMALKALREGGHRIGFVPTMGYLHEGHAALIKQSTARCNSTVVSVFVNPTQFGPNEDLARYPRDLDRDQNLCLKLGVDVLFLPEVSEIFPTGFSTFVEPGPMSGFLCGQFRPGHFRGVATIVAKLFNIVQPDLAFFGQKDLQQIAVIRRMIKDLNMAVDIVGVPTVREPDGLAMSSRNSYLSPEERKRALGLHRGLAAASAAFQQGERQAAALAALARACLEEVDDIQYCELVDAHTMESLEGEVRRAAALCIAALVGRTRLIDNVLLAPTDDGIQFINHLDPN
ncbi:MAG TPA: pantoate--beta-alanine ligase [Holophaga sp.]|nr:pantoate--beta-alanine ligase [Holophaga sp.]